MQRYATIYHRFTVCGRAGALLLGDADADGVYIGTRRSAVGAQHGVAEDMKK